MKKTIAILLAVLTLLSCAACGAPKEDKTPAADDVNKADETKELTVEKTPATVDVTIPASFFEDQDEESILAEAEEEGYLDCRINSDGSVTYTMTKEKHDEMLNELRNTLDEEINSLVEGEDSIASFTAIKHNDNMSKFDVYVDPAEYSPWDSLFGLVFYYSGAFYQMFDGVAENDVDVIVNFIDSETDEVLDTMSYKDYIAEMAEDDEDWESDRENLPEIEETVLLDHDGVKVTALEYTTDEWGDDAIKILIENNSSESVTVTCDDVFVNGFVFTGWLYATVPAGKKDYDTIEFSYETLAEAGIREIGTVEVQLYTYDPDSLEIIYTADMVEIRTSRYNVMDVFPDNVGEELYNDNGLVLYGRYCEDDWGNTGVLIYAENNSGMDIELECTELSVNGFMIESWYFEDIMNGRKTLSTMTFYQDDLDESGIDVIEEIECVFEASEPDEWETLFTTQPIRISVD